MLRGPPIAIAAMLGNSSGTKNELKYRNTNKSKWILSASANNAQFFLLWPTFYCDSCLQIPPASWTEDVGMLISPERKLHSWHVPKRSSFIADRSNDTVWKFGFFTALFWSVLLKFGLLMILLKTVRSSWPGEGRWQLGLQHKCPHPQPLISVQTEPMVLKKYLSVQHSAAPS